MICETLKTRPRARLRGLGKYLFQVKRNFCLVPHTSILALNNPYLFVVCPQIELMLCTLYPAFVVIFRAGYCRVSRLPSCQEKNSHLLFVVLEISNILFILPFLSLLRVCSLFLLLLSFSGGCHRKGKQICVRRKIL